MDAIDKITKRLKIRDPGIQQPRRAELRKKHLPGARVVSTSLSHSSNQSDVSKTLSVMQWSEFIAHDLAHTPARQMRKNLKNPINLGK